MKLPKTITIGEKYKPAMEITDQAEANKYFEDLVEHCMSLGKTREEAESIERQNLGYFAGYYNSETQERVERLFSCVHPVFGAISKKGQPTAEEALEAGRHMATKQTPVASQE
jgi:hypothetical protein